MKGLASGIVVGLLATCAASAALGTATLALFAPEPERRVYRRGFSFAIPQGWTCARSGTDEVCRPRDPEGARRYIMIATAKVAGVNDTREEYRNHLRNPRPAASAQDRTSKVVSYREELRDGVLWFIAEHRGAYMENYISHDAAARSHSIAFVVSMSCHQDERAACDRLSDQLHASIRVTR